MYASKNIYYDGLETPNLFKIGSLQDIERNTVLHTMSGYTTPQALALQLYGGREYDWVLYLLNSIVHPLYDWYMDDETLHDYCVEKYGENINRPNYFFYTSTGERLTDQQENDARYAYDNGTLPTFIGVVTNYEYEVTVNDKKATVKILPRNTIFKFIVAYNRQVNMI